MITNNFNMLKLSKGAEKNFKIKENLNDFEHYALAHALQDFVSEFEEKNYGEKYSDVFQYRRYITKGVDILDGIYDTYIFDRYAIDYIAMTDNGIILLYCYNVKYNQYNEYLPENIDYSAQVIFRLN